MLVHHTSMGATPGASANHNNCVRDTWNSKSAYLIPPFCG